MRKRSLLHKRPGKSTGVQWAANLTLSTLFILCISLAGLTALLQLAGSALDLQREVGTPLINLSDPKTGLPAAKQLARLDNIMRIRLLHETEINQVVIGKDGWLYIDDANSMDDHRGFDPYTDDELAALAGVINSRYQWLASRNIRMLLVVAPNKESIYPEHLPDTIYSVDNTTRLDQFMQYMKLHSDVDIIDLRPALLKAKADGQLFYATDSHWNYLGAFIAYTEVMKKLSAYFPYLNLKTPTLADYNIRTISGYTGDLEQLLFMDGLFPDQVVQMTPKDPSEANRWNKIQSAVIYHDSFYLLPDNFLSQDIVNSFPFWQGKDPVWDEAEITRDNPQIVIYFMVERYLDYYFPNP